MRKIYEIFGYHRLIVWNYCMATDPVSIVYESMINTVFVLYGDRAMHIRLELLTIIR